jgi:Holliday junction DNA helicase RuvA
VDVSGVGYKIVVMEEFLEGSEVEFFIHTHVRENDIVLFGFSKMKQMETFEMLTSVSGVGPKSAMSIIAEKGVDQILSSIEQSNPIGLKAKGIGQKTAEKIIVELKGKIAGMGYETKEDIVNSFDQNTYMDVIEALSSLGYRKSEIDNVLREKKIDTSIEAELIIKEILVFLRK